MGKTKRRNLRKHKPCPTGLPAVGDVEDDGTDSDDGGGKHVAADSSALRGLNGSSIATASKQHAIIKALKSLLDELQSNTEQDKESACCTLSSLIDKPEAVQHIVEMNFVRVIGPLLNDGNSVTRYAAIAALRKLSSVGHEVCEEMVSQDVMTPLICLYRKHYPSDWQPKKPHEGKLSSITATFIEAAYLLLNLCESSSRAVKAFNKENLIEVLIPCLNLDVYGDHVAVAVAYCLQTVTEDNSQAVAALNEKQNEEIVDLIFRLEGQTASHVLLRILAVGIILNRNFGRLSGCSPSYIVNMMKLLSDTINFKTNTLISVIADKLETEQFDSSVISLDWFLSAQQLSLELLINICCTDDEGDSWDDVLSSDASDGNPFVDDDLMEHEDLPSQAMLNMPTEILDAIVGHDFTNLVMAKLNLPPEDVICKLKKSSEGRKFLKQLMKIQSRALLCLNNLASCVDAEVLGGQSNLYDIWINLGKLLFEKQDLEFVEAATKAMGAIVQKLVEAQSSHFQQFSVEDLSKFFELVHTVEEAQVKANVVRIIGNIGCLMGKSIEICATQLKAIGLFLLDVCNRENEVWLACEAVDAILDVFGDDALHHLVQEIGMMEKLKSFLPQLKHKISNQRRDLDAHLPVVLTAKTNLVRFIKYKMTYEDNLSGENVAVFLWCC